MKPTTRRKIMDLCRWFANTKVDKKFASFQFDSYQPGKIYALEEPPNHKSNASVPGEISQKRLLPVDRSLLYDKGRFMILEARHIVQKRMKGRFNDETDGSGKIGGRPGVRHVRKPGDDKNNSDP